LRFDLKNIESTFKVAELPNVTLFASVSINIYVNVIKQMSQSQRIKVDIKRRHKLRGGGTKVKKKMN